MKKYKIGNKVVFTIHSIKYNAIIIDIDIVAGLFKIHNINTENIYWVEPSRLSKSNGGSDDKIKIKNT